MSEGPGDDRRSTTGDDWLGLVRAFVHDLRTPIATAAGYLELVQLDAGELPPPVPEYLDQAASALREVSLLATLMGDVARFEAGRRPLTLVAAEPRRILEGVLTRRPAHERARLAMPADDAGAPAVLRCDAELVTRTIGAMIHLALGRSPRDGVVTLLSRVDALRIRLGVRDQGTAIDEDRLPHLFVHRRSAGDSSSAAKLALVHARLVAEAHGGLAEARRPAEGGMEFWLELPAVSEGAPTR